MWDIYPLRVPVARPLDTPPPVAPAPERTPDPMRDSPFVLMLFVRIPGRSVPGDACINTRAHGRPGVN